MAIGYIDESHSGEPIPSMFCLTCTMAAGSEWPWIEMAWQKCVDEKNASLRQQKRPLISRYHSRDINSYRGEFKDWTGLKRQEFCEKLMKVFSRHTWGYEGYLINLKDAVKEWPEIGSDPLPCAYDVLLKFMMVEIGKGLSTEAPDCTMTLFHERSRYDGVLQDSFNAMMNDPTFAYKDFFTTIAPKGWEHCVPLQPADLVAYENFKEGYRTLPVRPGEKTRNRRIIFSELISLDSFVPHLRQLTRENIIELKRITTAAKKRKSERGASG